MARSEYQLYPSFTSELQEIRENGITKELLHKIITKHIPNSTYNRELYKRYKAIDNGVPIFNRLPRFEDENPINNKVNNDFFSEIVDFKTGYFAGEPISYGYSDTDESAEVTGGEKAIDEATKVLTDFTTRNNMFGVDMETTKNASIYGYSGRLFYIDREGTERVMPVHGYETIILSDTNIAEPEFAIRYYEVTDIHDRKQWIVEFYDNANITTYKGELMSLEEIGTRPHMFDYCPLQGVANNAELMGDAEKVLALIDDYDKVLSDNSNEIESFVHALLVLGVEVDDEAIHKAQKSGALIIRQVGSNVLQEPAKWLTKDINDTFTEHHLQRVEDNIYRFSQTPNLSDEAFGTASGVALKFKLHGLETKCATFEANVMNAAQHMWRVLVSSWRKKGKRVDPLQITMEFHRNFPQDQLSEAQTAQAYKAVGLPDAWIYGQLGIEDVDYVLELKKTEQEDAMEFYEKTQGNNHTALNDDDEDDDSKE